MISYNPISLLISSVFALHVTSKEMSIKVVSLAEVIAPSNEILHKIEFTLNLIRKRFNTTTEYERKGTIFRNRCGQHEKFRSYSFSSKLLAIQKMDTEVKALLVNGHEYDSLQETMINPVECFGLI